MHDCVDSSDECFCQGHVALLSGNKTVGCVSPQHFCHTPKLATFTGLLPNMEVNCSDLANAADVLNPIYRCFAESFSKITIMNRTEIRDFCEQNCEEFYGDHGGWRNYCQFMHVGSGSLLSMYRCVDGTTFSLSLNQICDGHLDCPEGLHHIITL